MLDRTSLFIFLQLASFLVVVPDPMVAWYHRPGHSSRISADDPLYGGQNAPAGVRLASVKLYVVEV
jgi:hypothetical protein